MIDRPMGPDDPTEASGHPTLGTRVARERARSALFGVAEAIEIGRFRVQERLGQGAMGVVYAAYDPKLDRRVALKVVTLAAPRGDSVEAKERLLREARAMAQLAHPNVVSVHEVVELPDGIAIAMELVQGMDLSQALERPRSWRETLELVCGAGRGLAAAHDAGLVHRDFKPKNVLVGEDGRARVTDFGLAIVVERIAQDEDGSETQTDPADGGRESSRHSGTRLRVAGTPVYIAPEVWVGRQADASSDQFSFAVAAYQAMFHERPFAGDSLSSIAAAVTEGVARTPRRGPVPRRIANAIMRGLAREPDDRFSSMSAMVDELERAGTSRRGLVMASTAFVGAAAIWAWVSRPPVCPDPRAELSVVWDDARRAEIAAAFEAAPGPGSTAWQTVGRRLDAYAQAWIDARRDTCEATYVRGEQSERDLDLRATCLDRARRDLRALLGQLQTADAGVVERAVAAVDALPSIAHCNDIESLRADPVSPPLPAIAADVAGAEEALTRVRAMVQTGRAEAASRDVEGLAAEAARLGYAPLLARVKAEAAFLREALDDISGSETLAEEALDAALDARDDLTALKAALHLAGLAAQRREHADADRWLAMAEVLVRRQRLGDLWSGRLLASRAYALRRRDDQDAAALALERAQILYEQAEAPATMRVDLLQGRAAVAARRMRGREALELGEAALALALDTFGPKHSLVAKSHGLLGHAAELLADYDAAMQHHENARSLYVELYGEEHFAVAEVDRALATILIAADRTDEAEQRLKRAIATMIRVHGPDSSEARDTRVQLLAVYNELDRNDDVTALASEVLASIERAQGTEDPETIGPLFYLAQSAGKRGELEAARGWITRVEHVSQLAYGENDPRLVQTHQLRAQIERVAGDFGAALHALDRAQAIQEAHGAQPVELADTQTIRAHTLFAQGRVDAARTAAVAAMAAYVAAGPSVEGRRRALDEWVRRNLP